MNRLNNFYRKKRLIEPIIFGKVNNDEIIYGAKAINAQVPGYLKKHTTDYDIFTNNPEKEAKEVERALDNAFGGNYFYVQPAIHPGTFKVKSKIDGQTYADFTKPDKKIPFKIIRGKRYIDLTYVIAHIKKTLKDKTAQFRWDKDRDALNRIKLASKNKNPFSGLLTK